MSAPSQPSCRVDSGNQLSKQMDSPKRPISGTSKVTQSAPGVQASYGRHGNTLR